MIKNFKYKRQGATIKLLVSILLCLFLVQIASAEIFTFDNKVDYSQDNMNARIVNFFGIGEWLGIDGTIGTIELKSHNSPTEIKGVLAGTDKAVMWYDFSGWKDIYMNGLGDVQFKDMKTGKIIEKSYYFATPVYEDVEVPTYAEVCGEVNLKEEGLKYQCWDKENGKKIERRIIRWERINENNIPKENITIGLITDVEEGDYIDGVWTIAGKKIKEHATWTAGNYAYVIANDLNRYLQYYVSDAWNITTGSFLPQNNLTINQDGDVGVGSMTGSCFDLNGNNLYLVGNNFDRIYQYKLSESGNISTAVFMPNNNLSVAGIDVTPFTCSINSDGTKFYMLGSEYDNLYQLRLTQAGNISTAVFMPNNNLSWAGIGENDMRQFKFSSDNGKVYMGGTTKDTIFTYNLSQSENISTGVFMPNSNLTAGGITGELAILGMSFKNDGTNFYFQANSLDKIFQFRMSSAWNLSTAVFMPNNNLTLNTNVPMGMFISGEQGETGGVTPSISVNINLPANDSFFTVNNVNFSGNATGSNVYFTNATLKVWNSTGGLVQTNKTDIYNGTAYYNTTNEINFSLSNFNTGSYHWNYKVCGNNLTATICSWASSNYTFNISLIPEIHFISPTPDNQTNLSTSSFITNVSLTEDYFLNLTFYLFNLSSGLLVEKDTYTDNTRWNNFSSIPDGNYTYNATMWTTAGDFNSTETRFIQIYTRNPDINITYPANKLNYQRLNTNLTINWSVSDGTLSSCLASYNNGTTNFSVLCNNRNITINVTSLLNNSFQIWANNSFGLSNMSSKTWTYTIFQTERLFSAITTEGAVEKFYLNFTQNSGLQTSAVSLVYNSTSYPSTFSILSNNVSSINSLTIPNKDFLQVIPFYWSILMSDGSVINTTIYNQTIDIFQIDDCTLYPTVIYNYTVYDEETKTKLTNTSVEIQIDLYDSLRTLKILNFSKLYSEINPAKVCINGSLFSNINYSVDSVVKYNSNDSGVSYADEYYNILGQLIGNQTIPKNIALYDLKNVDSTDFQLTFKDSNLAFAPNVLVYLYRQYVADNDFKVVEVPLTDSNGQTVLHMVRNNIVYNIVMVDSAGNILATFNKIIAFCQDYTIGSCTINLNARSGTDVIYDYLQDVGITYTQPTYSNATNEVSFTFSSTNLSSVTVKEEIIKNSNFGNRTVCEDTLTSATGTLSCDVSSITSSDRFLFVNIYVNGVLKTQSTIDLEQNTNGFGIVNGGFFALLFILFLIAMFMDDKQTLVISLVIGWAVVIALGLISGSLIGAVSGGIWLIVCAIIFLWKLKKEEQG